MIDLRQLEALRAVAQEGSVSRAALRLGWSQPTVDYHLKNLDRLAGTALLSRSSRGSTLTTAGSVMLERGIEILSLSERALVDVRDLSQLGRIRLRFGTFPTAAAQLLPQIAARLSEVGVEIDAVLEEVTPLVTRINQRELDAALLYTAGDYDLPFRADVHTTHVMRDPLLLALPRTHPLAELRIIDNEALLTLADEHWVLGATAGDTMDDIVRDVFAEAGHDIDVAIRTDDFSVVLGLVAAGMVIGLVPRLAATTIPAGVVIRPIADDRFAREIVLAAPGEGPGRQPPVAVRQLADAVRRSIEAIPEVEDWA